MAARQKLILPPPTASDVAADHADWLEVKALISADSNSSYADLVAELRRSGSLDASSDPLDLQGEKSQEIADAALAELDIRSRICGDHYPFLIDDQVAQLRSSEARTWPYMFMLLLKTFGVSVGPRSVKGATHFEELAAVCAREYLGGEAKGAKSIHFGFPRRLGPSGFTEAVEDLTERIGEGGGSRLRPSRRSQKDAKLDIVAWRPFPDNQPGKMIAFGQCAAGDNWDGKVSELRPISFTSLWLKDRRLSLNPLVFFYVPGCFSSEEWELVASFGDTIPFDRCRLTHLVPSAILSQDLRQRTATWVNFVLNRLR